MNTTTAAAPSTTQSGRGLHIALWIVQALLGIAFTMAGFTKVGTPMAKLAEMMPWTAVVGESLTRFIGASELLGGIGLILPAATRIKPGLTPLAGVGLTTVMVLAAGYHLTHNEAAFLPINLVLGSLAAFVAWGRGRKAPIAPRS